MDRSTRCTSCGAELLSDSSPEGFCANCLLNLALMASEGADVVEDVESVVLPSAQTESDISTATPTHIGPYRILQQVGEGGMGQVFLAEQSTPVRRRVALKLIKLGMDSKQVVARFESERQALALMDHPSIAKVFDGGTTDQGRPYFVMEYIEGEPITHYCDRHRLGIEERLELFVRVCDAVQHAHQKGVIHRDIKPSNVLVGVQGQQPVPRVIDFGVAKATQQRLTERTLFTRLGVLIGTPEYMSPEQAEMTTLDVDTRTDVYSLGVLLYELLVGKLPFDPAQLRRAGFDEIRRKIREDEPSRPSTKIGTLGAEESIEAAKIRSSDPPSLQRQLRGELDWITMKALEKDRARRYQSASDLAADIGRHFTDEPVLAGPPSTVYRAKKFVRRHRVGAAVFGLVLSLLVVFGVTMTVQAGRIARERDRANREAETSSRIAEFMTGIFAVSNPARVDAEKVSAEELLDRAVERIDTELIDEPEIRGRLMREMGSAYIGLSLFDRAAEILGRSSETLRGSLGEMHPDALIADQGLAGALWRLNRLDEAEVLLQATLEKQRRVLGDDHRDTMNTWRHLANVTWRRGDHAEAAKLYEAVLSRSRRVLGPEHHETLMLQSNVAHMYMNLGLLEEAETIQRATLEAQRRVLGDDQRATIESMHVLGVILRLLGRLDEAEQALDEAVERFSATLGDDHLYTISTTGDLAAVDFSRERYADAEAGFRRAHEAYVRTLGEEHPRTVFAAHRVALAIFRQDRLREAEEMERQILEHQRRIVGSEHPKTLMMVQTMADIYNEMDDPDRARPMMAELLAHRQKEAEASEASANVKNRYAWSLLNCRPSDLQDPQTALTFALSANDQSGYSKGGHLYTLALAYHLTGDSLRAAEIERQAATLEPKSSEYVKRLAEHEAQAGVRN